MAGWTKADIITQAFGKIGVAGYVFDVLSADSQNAMRELDLMAAYWSGRGLRLGYTRPTSANSGNVGDDSGVKSTVLAAVVTNLALRLAPTVGMEPRHSLLVEAKDTLNALRAMGCVPPPLQLPSDTPAGAGNKTWRSAYRPFLDCWNDMLESGSDGVLEFK